MKLQYSDLNACLLILIVLLFKDFFHCFDCRWFYPFIIFSFYNFSSLVAIYIEGCHSLSGTQNLTYGINQNSNTSLLGIATLSPNETFALYHFSRNPVQHIVSKKIYNTTCASRCLKMFTAQKSH